MYYILEDKKPVKVDLMTFAHFKADFNSSIVKQDKISDAVRVSTVFLGLDHAFDGGTPILFETMIFGGELDGYQERYHTWEEAEQGHAKALSLIPHRSTE